MGHCDDIRSLNIFIEWRTVASSSKKKARNLVRREFIAITRYFTEARKKQLARVSRKSYSTRGCGNCEGRTYGKGLHGARN